MKIKERNKKALEKNGKQLVKSSVERQPAILLKQKEIFEELANEKMSEIQNLSK